jgi:hypothetical protein
MPRPAFIEIDGKLYLRRDILVRRKEQLRAHAAAQQPPRSAVCDRLLNVTEPWSLLPAVHSVND